MKTRLGSIPAVLLGLAVAVAAECAEPNSHAPLTPAAERAGARVVVEREEHDFGAIDVEVTGRHDFVFTNAGDRPLVLTRGRSTCGCCTCVCAVRLPEGRIAPGMSASVTLEWTSKLYVGPFRQTATIGTNDPNRPEVTLHVAGRFKGPVGVVPSLVRLSGISPGESVTTEVRLINYMSEPLEIVGFELADPTTAEHFDVAWERLAAERLRDDAEARGGYLVRITLKPGLPVGSFRQRILLETHSATVPTVEIPIEGTVASDVFVAGRGWNAQTGTLSMGTVNRRRGAEWTLLVVVRGPHAADVKLEPVEVVPQVLDVSLGPTIHTSSKALSRTRLTIRIPSGSEPAVHLGSGHGEPGRIVLKSNHPQVPELRMRVRFAVAE
jgi:hypothetical protein